MTLDDLARLICETQNVDGFKCTCPVPFEPDWCNGNRAKAQARAVVRALRDEFGRIMEPSDDWNRMGVVDVFNEILGDAGEKVAGGSSRDASKATEASGARCATPCASAPATDPIRDAVAMARGRVLVVDDIPMLNKLAAAMKPATDAAPAVCVWNPNAKGWWVASCDKRYSFRKSALSKLSKCPECNAPIKFKSALSVTHPSSLRRPIMDEAHKELVSVLRKRAELAAQEGNMTATCDARYFAQSADALETMAGEVARLASALEGADQEVQERLLSTEAERDCLKAALEPFAKLETYRGAHDPAEGTMRMRVVTVPEIEAARKALGGDA